MKADPSERVDVFDPGDPHHQEMTENLRRFKVSLVKAHRDWSKRQDESSVLTGEEKIRRLKSLAYIE